MRTRSGRNGIRSTFRETRARSARPLLESLEARNLLAQFTDINFDFGTATSPVASGYVGVAPVAYSATKGYGWLSTSGISAINRGGSNPLTSDLQAGSNNTFAVDVPNGIYSVQVTLGDPSQLRGPMTVSAEGQAIVQDILTLPGKTSSRSQNITVTDGQLDVKVSGILFGYAIDGLQVHRLTPAPTPAPAPIASAGPNQSSSEGTPVTFQGTASGWVNPTYSWNFGDGSGVTGTLTPQHTYADNGIYTATLTVSSGSTTVQSSTAINVANVAPTATITGAPANSLEGSAVVLGSLVTDPSPVDTAAGFSESWSVTKNGASFATGSGAGFSFTPDDNGTYVVSLNADDKDGGVGAATQTIIVMNVAPTASAGGPYAGPSGQSLTLQGTATDPSPTDTAAGFLYTWSFGDGTTASGQGLTSPTHTYALAGTYTVSLVVTDKDSGASLQALAPVTELAPVLVVTGPTVPPPAPPPPATVYPPGVLTSVGLTPGWATFGEVFTEGQATEGGLEVGNLPTQTDVKNLWPDGSIKYAIVTTHAATAGTYDITQAAPNAGGFAPTIPMASVQFTIGGVLYTATLPSSMTNDLWLSGPLATEWCATVDPADSSGDLQPFLRVVFDTRVYNDGGVQLQVTVQDELDLPGATAVSYDVNVNGNGQSLFSQAGVTQYYLTNWTKSFDLGLTESQPILDFTNFYAAGALPQFLTSIANQDYSTAGPTFGILGRGGNSYDYMGSTGGRPEIAPYPDWVAEYSTYQTPDQYNYLLANGSLAGSWPIHIENADGSLVSIDAKPDFYLDPRGQVPYLPADDQPKGDLSYADDGPLVPDTAHTPSLAYVPYLVTGDHYFADEMAQWGSWGLIGTFYAPLSQGGRGESLGIVGVEQVRGRAWSLRNLTDAAAYLPDTDPDKTYFASKVENNLSYYDSFAQANNTPLGTVFARDDGSGNLVISQWEDNYLAWSIEHANDQGFAGGDQLADQIAAFQLRMFTSGSDYPREYAGPYWPIVGHVGSDGSWQYFTTMGQMFNANYVNSDGSELAPVPFVGFYDADVRISLMIAIDEGMPGAQEAYDWLWPQISTDVNNQAGWAVTRI